jgi:hypothetical protein
MRPSSSTAAAPAASSAVRPAASLSPGVAPSVLGTALLLGVAGDALVRGGGIGLGVSMWIALIVASVVSLAWRAELAIPRETSAWLAVALVCGAGLTWRNAEMLQFLNVVGAMGALIMAAASLNRPGSVLLAPRLRDTLSAFFSTAFRSAIGIIPLATHEVPASLSTVELKSRFGRWARAIVIAGVVLVIFGGLLRGADPIFASLIRLPAFDMDEVIGHIALTVFFAAVLGGGARAALLDKEIGSAAPLLRFFQLGSLEITATLATLNVLFAAFVLTQLGWFFGGEQFLRERTGLTVAEYARSGFFQMVWVVALVVPLLVATRAMLLPGRALARRHTALALPIVGLLGAMIVSAMLRMNLYVHYYGLSTDRLYPLAFMAWLSVVLVWLVVTVLRDWGRPFAAGAAVSGLATLLTLNVMAPDRLVARINIQRAASGDANVQPLDLPYLSHLSGEATELAVAAVLAEPKQPIADASQRCTAARTLLSNWTDGSFVDGAWVEEREPRKTEGAAQWRRWNAGDRTGRRAVAAHRAELIRIASSCPSAPAKKS